MSIPAGFAPHPQAAGWMYELANPNNVLQVPADPSPPAYPQQPQYPAQPYAAPPQSAAATVHTQYGQADSSLIDEEIEGLQTYGKSDLLYLDFKKVERINEEATMRIRFLPPWSQEERLPYLNYSRHQFPPGIVPDSKSKFPGADCYNTKGGPLGCPVCAEVEALLSSGQLSEEDQAAVRKMQAKMRIRWQGINFDDLNAHWAQNKDEGGSVIVDQTGQPEWRLVPGIFSCGQKLHRQLLTVWKHWGDPTSPDSGYLYTVSKRKIGPEDFNVEYNAVNLPKQPLEAELRSVLGNLIDLRKLLFFRDRAGMDSIANALRLKYRPQQQSYPQPQSHQQQQRQAVPPALLPPPPTSPQTRWYPHPEAPGYEYNDAGQVRPVAAAPALPPPPPTPPRPPAAPLASPSGSTGYVGGPPRPPSPPGPQGGYQAAVPMPPGMLPPATAPGMRAGHPVGPIVPPPPPAGMGGVISPSELEAQLRAAAQPPPGGYPSRPGDPPF